MICGGWQSDVLSMFLYSLRSMSTAAVTIGNACTPAHFQLVEGEMSNLLFIYYGIENLIGPLYQMYSLRSMSTAAVSIGNACGHAHCQLVKAKMRFPLIKFTIGIVNLIRPLYQMYSLRSMSTAAVTIGNACIVN